MPLKRRSGEDRRQRDEGQPTLGPRMEALKRRKRISLVKETSVAMSVAAVLLLVVGLVVWNAAGDANDERRDRPRATGPAEDPINATLFVGTREKNSEMVWLTLVTHDAEGDRGSVIYIPAHTAVEVPGRGLQSLADAHSSGGIPLLLISAENLLGIDIDHHVELSDNAAKILVGRTGTMSVNVPEEVTVKLGASAARVVFDPGPQRLPSDLLVQLLYTVGLEGDDEELGGRHLAFWDALFDTYEETPKKLVSAFEHAGSALGESNTEPAEIAAQIGDIVRLPGHDRSIALLPVQQVSVGGSELYATTEKELVAFLDDTVGEASAPIDEIEVQVLNGNGRPGIGQAVADRLIGHGFKVVISSNARHFDYDETLIITYEDSDHADAIAEQARSLIGMGEVQISANQQGIVDLTIVVGKDFLRTL
jgi:hypothetical protein